jgi:EmrB/QacA subfamily drug resistance transporter
MPAAPATAAPEPLDLRSVRAIVLGTLLAMFLGALDQTIVATALPTIGRAFGDVEGLSWVVSAYLLTATTVTPLYGKLSDIHGRRAMLLVAISVFCAGSIAAALAPSMTTLIIARALQGAGGGGLMSLAQTIIGDVVTPVERGRYQGMIGMVFATSSLGGPVLGGFFAEHLHWSLIFWINLPLGLVAFVLTNNVLKRLPRHERPHRLDIAGAGLMMAATVALLLALTWGGTRYSWSSPPIVGLATLSLLLFGLFVIRLTTAPEPFLPLSVLLNPVVGIGTASASCVFGTLIALSIFVPLYFEVVLGLSASSSGLALIPLMGGTVVGSTASGHLMPRLPRYKRMPVIGLAIAIAALLPLAIDPAGLSLPAVCVALGLAGLGMGSLFPITTVAVQNAVPPYQLGTATAAMNFFRQLSGALMVTGYGALLLGGAGAAAHQGLTLETLVAAAGGAGAGALGNLFRWVFAAASLGLAAGLALILVMEERPLRGRADVEVPAAAE